MFTVNDGRITNQLETAHLTMNKWLFYQNGFTRTSLSATVTRLSNFVEENVFLFLHGQGSRPGAFSHSLPNT